MRRRLIATSIFDSSSRTRRYYISFIHVSRLTTIRCLKYLALVTTKGYLAAIATRYWHVSVLDRRASGIGRSTRDQVYWHFSTSPARLMLALVRSILSREDLRFPAVRFRRTRSSVGKHTKYIERRFIDRSRNISHKLILSQQNSHFSQNDWTTLISIFDLILML